MQKVLVTGAAGFIGFYTMKCLLEGYVVVGLDNINDCTPRDVNQTWADVNDLKGRYGYNPDFSVEQGS